MKTKLLWLSIVLTLVLACQTLAPTPFATPTYSDCPPSGSDIPEEIEVRLQELGFDSDCGEVGWMQPSGDLELVHDESADSSLFAEIQADNPVFQDYVMSIDVDWGNNDEEVFGGCGIFLRVTEGQAEAVAFYTSLSILSNSWDLEHWNTDGYVGSLLKNQGSRFQPGVLTDDIRSGTNHYDLVVTGNSLLVYVNGSPINYVGGEEVGPEFMPEDLTEGTIAVFARRETGGGFTCMFSNGWIWRQ